MQQHQKLVRDKIPDIIRNKGEIVVARVLTNLEIKGALKAKLVEETKELMEATKRDQIILEFADVKETLDALCRVYNAEGTLVLCHERPEGTRDWRVSLHAVAKAISLAKNVKAMLPTFFEQLGKALDQLCICEPELKRKQEARREERGGFENGTFLISTTSISVSA